VTGDAALDAAYAHCLALASSHYENFPVASWLVPAPIRPHVAAVYAFARSADDFADEDGYDTAERFRRLDDWLSRLHVAAGPGADASDPIFLALGHTIRTCKLPVDLFEALLSAFRQDITVTRYATWADVDDYCRRSANPVDGARRHLSSELLAGLRRGLAARTALRARRAVAGEWCHPTSFLDDDMPRGGSRRWRRRPRAPALFTGDVRCSNTRADACASSSRRRGAVARVLSSGRAASIRWQRRNSASGTGW
jgi:hypothetical protein